MATHPSIPAGEITWTEPGGLQDVGSQKSGRNSVSKRQQMKNGRKQRDKTVNMPVNEVLGENEKKKKRPNPQWDSIRSWASWEMHRSWE